MHWYRTATNGNGDSQPPGYFLSLFRAAGITFVTVTRFSPLTKAISSSLFFMALILATASSTLWLELRSGFPAAGFAFTAGAVFAAGAGLVADGLGAGAAFFAGVLAATDFAAGFCAAASDLALTFFFEAFFFASFFLATFFFASFFFASFFFVSFFFAPFFFSSFFFPPFSLPRMLFFSFFFLSFFWSFFLTSFPILTLNWIVLETMYTCRLIF